MLLKFLFVFPTTLHTLPGCLPPAPLAEHQGSPGLDGNYGLSSVSWFCVVVFPQTGGIQQSNQNGSAFITPSFTEHVVCG